MFKKVLLYIIALGLIFVGSWISMGLLHHIPISVGFIFTGGKAGIISGTIVILRFIINVLFIICGIGLLLRKLWAKKFTIILISINLCNHLYELIGFLVRGAKTNTYLFFLLLPILYSVIIVFLVFLFPKKEVLPPKPEQRR